MATSGSHRIKAMWDRDMYLEFSWYRTSVSISGNYSVISWSLKWISEQSMPCISLTSTDWSVNVDGTRYSGTFNNTTTGVETKTMASGTETIYHQADGSMAFFYSFSHYVGLTYGTKSDSGTATLDPIPKPATLLTAPNFTDEQNPAITYSNPYGTVLETLEACIADSKGQTIYVPYRAVTKTGSSYTFYLTIDERNTLRSAAGGSSLAVRFYLKSVIEGITTYKHLDRTMTLDDIAPVINPTVRDNDTTIVALTGNDQKIILGYSDIYYSIGVTPPSGTSIISKSIRCGNQSKTTNSGTFTNVDTNVIEFSATDSRGNVALETVEMEVVPYINVTCNQTVRLNLDGTIALVVKGNYFSDSFGAQNNTLKIEARSRESGQAWSEWGDISVLLADASGGTYTLTATMSGFDPSGTYEFQARATDKLTSAESTIDPVTLKPIFDWGKYDFNFNVPLTIEGNSLDDYVIETGTEAMGTNGTWYWSKWKSGKAECYGCRNYGNMAVTTDWGGLFRSEPFTQSFPTGLFNATPEVIDVTFRGGSNVGGWISMHEDSAPSDYESGSFIMVRPASATMTQVYLSFNIIGRWK